MHASPCKPLWTYAHCTADRLAYIILLLTGQLMSQAHWPPLCGWSSHHALTTHPSPIGPGFPGLSIFSVQWCQGIKFGHPQLEMFLFLGCYALKSILSCSHQTVIKNIKILKVGSDSEWTNVPVCATYLCQLARTLSFSAPSDAGLFMPCMPKFGIPAWFSGIRDARMPTNGNPVWDPPIILLSLLCLPSTLILSTELIVIGCFWPDGH